MKGFSGRLAAWGSRPAAELDAATLHIVADSQAAARLRAHQRDPNVLALTIERSRDGLDRWGWMFLFAGLAYTTVNVQAFVANGSVFPSLRWSTAWLVEPMVMGLMLVLLRGEQLANRYGESAGRWVKGTRWAALLITYVMNTGTYWGAGNPGEIFQHSVPVILVACAAEALVQQRQTLTRVVDRLGADVPPTVPSRPETAQDGPDRPGPDEETQDQLLDARTHSERAYEAFKELCAEGRDPDSLRPSEVDKRAEVPTGTSKRTGRMERFARMYREEVNGDEDGRPGQQIPAG